MTSVTDETEPYVSHADLGGSTGHGRVQPEPEDVVFHHWWEARALALTLAAGAPGGWNIDMSRRARETLPDYTSRSYYEIWTAALERLVVEHGLASPAEVVAGRAAAPGDDRRRVLAADRVAAALARGGPTDREPAGPARFAIGDRVLTRAGRVDHHTRLPGYVAGCQGSIERVHGAHVFPDTNAHGLGEDPQWLYTVVFDATDLWSDAAPGLRVSVDAWEPYLSPVEADVP
jgi:nitrile hydratase subunit beta